MGLVGRIEDVGLAEIFHIVSRSRKTGTLVLNADSGAAAVVVFDEGKVIQAATNDLRDSLGSLLFVQGLVDEGNLRRALEIQRGPQKGMRLGQILVGMKILTPEKLEGTVRKHIENLVCMLLTWEAGSFRFETGRSELDEGLESATRELLIDDGLSAEYLLMESARILDESNRKNGSRPAATGPPPGAATLDRRRPVLVVKEYRPSEAAVPPPVAIKVGQMPVGATSAVASRSAAPPQQPAGRPLSGLSSPSSREPSPEPDAAQRVREMEMLHAASQGMRAQSSLTGTALVAIRYARSLVGRAAMFRVSGDEISEIGQLGMKPDGGSPDLRERKAKLPAGGGSVFAEVIRDGTPKRGRFPAGSWDRAFVKGLGGTEPDEYFMVPAVCEGKVMIVLYGDNAPGVAPVPATTGLEVLMLQVALTLEKALLQERLREIPNAAPHRPAARP